jgi:hypothetical protein
VAGLPLRYIVPSTIEPELDEVAGLTGFWRTLGKSRKWATTDDLLYFWKPDPSVELGPPTTSAVMAALSAAGVLYSIDAFAAAFVNRGAIKATLLTVEGNLLVTGTITGQGGLTGAAGLSFETHKHGGVAVGVANSGGPVP